MRLRFSPRATKKSVASIVTAAFFFTTVGEPFAQANFWTERQTSRARLATMGGGTPEPLLADIHWPKESLHPVLDSYRLPSELGTVLESQTFDSTHPNVIYIQDAHGHYNAQYSASEILDGLQRAGWSATPGLTVYQEGGVGPANIEWLSTFPDETIREKVAHAHLRHGDITGEEYRSVVASSGTFRLVGVETRPLYRKNLAARHETALARAQAEKDIVALQSRLVTVKEKIYPAPLLAVDRPLRSYRNQEIDFLDCLRALAAVPGSVTIGETPNLATLLRLSDLEKTLDFHALSTERDDLILRVSKRLSPPDIKILAAQATDVRLGRMKLHSFYESFLGILAKWRGEKDLFPTGALRRYVTYLKLADSLRHTEMLAEFNRLSTSLLDRMATTNRLRHWVNVDRRAGIERLLWKQEMTPDDYTRFKQEGPLDWEAVERDLLLEEHQLGLGETSKGLLAPSGTKSSSGYPWTRWLPQVYSFYELALERDRALVDNALADMSRGGIRRAVLIAGGFHTPGITRLFRDQGVNYVVIQPGFNEGGPSLGAKDLVVSDSLSRLAKSAREANQLVSSPGGKRSDFASGFLMELVGLAAVESLSLSNEERSRYLLDLKKWVQSLGPLAPTLVAAYLVGNTSENQVYVLFAKNTDGSSSAFFFRERGEAGSEEMAFRGEINSRNFLKTSGHIPLPQLRDLGMSSSFFAWVRARLEALAQLSGTPEQIRAGAARLTVTNVSDQAALQIADFVSEDQNFLLRESRRGEAIVKTVTQVTLIASQTTPGKIRKFFSEFFARLFTGKSVWAGIVSASVALPSYGANHIIELGLMADPVSLGVLLVLSLAWMARRLWKNRESPQEKWDQSISALSRAIREEDRTLEERGAAIVRSLRQVARVVKKQKNGLTKEQKTQLAPLWSHLPRSETSFAVMGDSYHLTRTQVMEIFNIWEELSSPVLSAEKKTVVGWFADLISGLLPNQRDPQNTFGKEFSRFVKRLKEIFSDKRTSLFKKWSFMAKSLAEFSFLKPKKLLINFLLALQVMAPASAAAQMMREVEGVGSVVIGIQADGGALKVFGNSINPGGERMQQEEKSGTTTAPVSSTTRSAVVSTRSSSLNVREAPHFKSPIRGAWPKGSIITILEQRGGWVLTEKGWVSSRYLSSLNSTGASEFIPAKPTSVERNLIGGEAAAVPASPEEREKTQSNTAGSTVKQKVTLAEITRRSKNNLNVRLTKIKATVAAPALYAMAREYFGVDTSLGYWGQGNQHQLYAALGALWSVDSDRLSNEEVLRIDKEIMELTQRRVAAVAVKNALELHSDITGPLGMSRILRSEKRIEELNELLKVAREHVSAGKEASSIFDEIQRRIDSEKKVLNDAKSLVRDQSYELLRHLGWDADPAALEFVAPNENEEIDALIQGRVSEIARLDLAIALLIKDRAKAAIPDTYKAEAVLSVAVSVALSVLSAQSAGITVPLNLFFGVELSNDQRAALQDAAVWEYAAALSQAKQISEEIVADAQRTTVEYHSIFNRLKDLNQRVGERQQFVDSLRSRALDVNGVRSLRDLLVAQDDEEEIKRLRNNVAREADRQRRNLFSSIGGENAPAAATVRGPDSGVLGKVSELLGFSGLSLRLDDMEKGILSHNFQPLKAENPSFFQLVKAGTDRSFFIGRFWAEERAAQARLSAEDLSGETVWGLGVSNSRDLSGLISRSFGVYANFTLSDSAARFRLLSQRRSVDLARLARAQAEGEYASTLTADLEAVSRIQGQLAVNQRDINHTLRSLKEEEIVIKGYKKARETQRARLEAKLSRLFDERSSLRHRLKAAVSHVREILRAGTEDRIDFNEDYRYKPLGLQYEAWRFDQLLELNPSGQLVFSAPGRERAAEILASAQSVRRFTASLQQRMAERQGSAEDQETLGKMLLLIDALVDVLQDDRKSPHSKVLAASEIAVALLVLNVSLSPEVKWETLEAQGLGDTLRFWDRVFMGRFDPHISRRMAVLSAEKLQLEAVREQKDQAWKVRLDVLPLVEAILRRNLPLLVSLGLGSVQVPRSVVEEVLEPVHQIAKEAGSPEGVPMLPKAEARRIKADEYRKLAEVQIKIAEQREKELKFLREATVALLRGLYASRAELIRRLAETGEPPEKRFASRPDRDKNLGILAVRDELQRVLQDRESEILRVERELRAANLDFSDFEKNGNGKPERNMDIDAGRKNAGETFETKLAKMREDIEKIRLRLAEIQGKWGDGAGLSVGANTLGAKLITTLPRSVRTPRGLQIAAARVREQAQETAVVQNSQASRLQDQWAAYLQARYKVEVYQAMLKSPLPIAEREARLGHRGSSSMREVKRNLGLAQKELYEATAAIVALTKDIQSTLGDEDGRPIGLGYFPDPHLLAEQSGALAWIQGKPSGHPRSSPSVRQQEERAEQARLKEEAVNERAAAPDLAFSMGVQDGKFQLTFSASWRIVGDTAVWEKLLAQAEGQQAEEVKKSALLRIRSSFEQSEREMRDLQQQIREINGELATSRNPSTFREAIRHHRLGVHGLGEILDNHIRREADLLLRRQFLVARLSQVYLRLTQDLQGYGVKAPPLAEVLQRVGIPTQTKSILELIKENPSGTSPEAASQALLKKVGVAPPHLRLPIKESGNKSRMPSTLFTVVKGVTGKEIYFTPSHKKVSSRHSLLQGVQRALAAGGIESNENTVLNANDWVFLLEEMQKKYRDPPQVIGQLLWIWPQVMASVKISDAREIPAFFGLYVMPFVQLHFPSYGQYLSDPVIRANTDSALMRKFGLAFHLAQEMQAEIDGGALKPGEARSWLAARLSSENEMLSLYKRHFVSPLSVEDRDRLHEWMEQRATLLDDAALRNFSEDERAAYARQARRAAEIMFPKITNMERFVQPGWNERQRLPMNGNNRLQSLYAGLMSYAIANGISPQDLPAHGNMLAKNFFPALTRYLGVVHPSDLSGIPDAVRRRNLMRGAEDLMTQLKKSQSPAERARLTSWTEAQREILTVEDEIERMNFLLANAMFWQSLMLMEHSIPTQKASLSPENQKKMADSFNGFMEVVTAYRDMPLATELARFMFRLPANARVNPVVEEYLGFLSSLAFGATERDLNPASLAARRAFVSQLSTVPSPANHTSFEASPLARTWSQKIYEHANSMTWPATGVPYDNTSSAGQGYTKSTNIGLYLLLLMVGREKNFESPNQVDTRLDKVLTSLSYLPIENEGRGLWPEYIKEERGKLVPEVDRNGWISYSTVDSAWLTVALLLIRENRSLPERIRKKAGDLVEKQDYNSSVSPVHGALVIARKRLASSGRVVEDHSQYSYSNMSTEARGLVVALISAGMLREDVLHRMNFQYEVKDGIPMLETWKESTLASAASATLFPESQWSRVLRLHHWNFGRYARHWSGRQGYAYYGWAPTAAPNGTYVEWSPSHNNEYISPYGAALQTFSGSQEDLQNMLNILARLPSSSNAVPNLIDPRTGAPVPGSRSVSAETPFLFLALNAATVQKLTGNLGSKPEQLYRQLDQRAKPDNANRPLPALPALNTPPGVPSLPSSPPRPSGFTPSAQLDNLPAQAPAEGTSVLSKFLALIKAGLTVVLPSAQARESIPRPKPTEEDEIVRYQAPESMSDTLRALILLFKSKELRDMANEAFSRTGVSVQITGNSHEGAVYKETTEASALVKAIQDHLGRTSLSEEDMRATLLDLLTYLRSPPPIVLESRPSINAALSDLKRIRSALADGKEVLLNAPPSDYQRQLGEITLGKALSETAEIQPMYRQIGADLFQELTGEEIRSPGQERRTEQEWADLTERLRQKKPKLFSHETVETRVDEARMVEEGTIGVEGKSFPGLAFEAVSKGRVQSLVQAAMRNGKTLDQLKVDLRLLMRMRATYMLHNKGKEKVLTPDGRSVYPSMMLSQGAYYSFITLRELGGYNEAQLLRLIRTTAMAERYHDTLLVPGVKQELMKRHGFSEKEAEKALRKLPRPSEYWFIGVAHRQLERGEKEEKALRDYVRGHGWVPDILKQGYWYSNLDENLNDYVPGDLLLVAFFNDAIIVQTALYAQTGRFLSGPSFYPLVRLMAKGMPLIPHNYEDGYVQDFMSSIAKRDLGYGNLRGDGNLRRDLFDLFWSNFKRTLPIEDKDAQGNPTLMTKFMTDARGFEASHPQIEEGEQVTYRDDWMARLGGIYRNFVETASDFSFQRDPKLPADQDRVESAAMNLVQEVSSNILSWAIDDIRKRRNHGILFEQRKLREDGAEAQFLHRFREEQEERKNKRGSVSDSENIVSRGEIFSQLRRRVSQEDLKLSPFQIEDYIRQGIRNGLTVGEAALKGAIRLRVEKIYRQKLEISGPLTNLQSSDIDGYVESLFWRFGLVDSRHRSGYEEVLGVGLEEGLTRDIQELSRVFEIRAYLEAKMKKMGRVTRVEELNRMATAAVANGVGEKAVDIWIASAEAAVRQMESVGLHREMVLDEALKMSDIWFQLGIFEKQEVPHHWSVKVYLEEINRRFDDPKIEKLLQSTETGRLILSMDFRQSLAQSLWQKKASPASIQILLRHVFSTALWYEEMRQFEKNLSMFDTNARAFQQSLPPLDFGLFLLAMDKQNLSPWKINAMELLAKMVAKKEGISERSAYDSLSGRADRTNNSIDAAAVLGRYGLLKYRPDVPDHGTLTRWIREKIQPDNFVSLLTLLALATLITFLIRVPTKTRDYLRARPRPKSTGKMPGSGGGGGIGDGSPPPINGGRLHTHTGSHWKYPRWEFKMSLTTFLNVLFNLFILASASLEYINWAVFLVLYLTNIYIMFFLPSLSVMFLIFLVRHIPPRFYSMAGNSWVGQQLQKAKKLVEPIQEDELTTRQLEDEDDPFKGADPLDLPDEKPDGNLRATFIVESFGDGKPQQKNFEELIRLAYEDPHLEIIVLAVNRSLGPQSEGYEQRLRTMYEALTKFRYQGRVINIFEEFGDRFHLFFRQVDTGSNIRPKPLPYHGFMYWLATGESWFPEFDITGRKIPLWEGFNGFTFPNESSMRRVPLIDGIFLPGNGTMEVKTLDHQSLDKIRHQALPPEQFRPKLIWAPGFMATLNADTSWDRIIRERLNALGKEDFDAEDIASVLNEIIKDPSVTPSVLLGETSRSSEILQDIMKKHFPKSENVESLPEMQQHQLKLLLLASLHPQGIHPLSKIQLASRIKIMSIRDWEITFPIMEHPRALKTMFGLLKNREKYGDVAGFQPRIDNSNPHETGQTLLDSLAATGLGFVQIIEQWLLGEHRAAGKIFWVVNQAVEDLLIASEENPYGAYNSAAVRSSDPWVHPYRVLAFLFGSLAFALSMIYVNPLLGLTLMGVWFTVPFLWIPKYALRIDAGGNVYSQLSHDEGEGVFTRIILLYRYVMLDSARPSTAKNIWVYFKWFVHFDTHTMMMRILKAAGFNPAARYFNNLVLRAPLTPFVWVVNLIIGSLIVHYPSLFGIALPLLAENLTLVFVGIMYALQFLMIFLKQFASLSWRGNAWVGLWVAATFLLPPLLYLWGGLSILVALSTLLWRREVKGDLSLQVILSSLWAKISRRGVLEVAVPLPTVFLDFWEKINRGDSKTHRDIYFWAGEKRDFEKYYETVPQGRRDFLAPFTFTNLFFLYIFQLAASGATLIPFITIIFRFIRMQLSQAWNNLAHRVQPLWKNFLQMPADEETPLHYVWLFRPALTVGVVLILLFSASGAAPFFNLPWFHWDIWTRLAVAIPSSFTLFLRYADLDSEIHFRKAFGLPPGNSQEAWDDRAPGEGPRVVHKSKKWERSLYGWTAPTIILLSAFWGAWFASYLEPSFFLRAFTLLIPFLLVGPISWMFGVQLKGRFKEPWHELGIILGGLIFFGVVFYYLNLDSFPELVQLMRGMAATWFAAPGMDSFPPSTALPFSGVTPMGDTAGTAEVLRTHPVFVFAHLLVLSMSHVLGIPAILTSLFFLFRYSFQPQAYSGKKFLRLSRRPIRIWLTGLLAYVAFLLIQSYLGIDYNQLIENSQGVSSLVVALAGSSLLGGLLPLLWSQWWNRRRLDSALRAAGIVIDEGLPDRNRVMLAVKNAGIPSEILNYLTEAEKKIDVKNLPGSLGQNLSEPQKKLIQGRLVRFISSLNSSDWLYGFARENLVSLISAQGTSTNFRNQDDDQLIKQAGQIGGYSPDVLRRVSPSSLVLVQLEQVGPADAQLADNKSALLRNIRAGLERFTSTIGDPLYPWPAVGDEGAHIGLQDASFQEKRSQGRQTLLAEVSKALGENAVSDGISDSELFDKIGRTYRFDESFLSLFLPEDQALIRQFGEGEKEDMPEDLQTSLRDYARTVGDMLFDNSQFLFVSPTNRELWKFKVDRFRLRESLSAVRPEGEFKKLNDLQLLDVARKTNLEEFFSSEAKRFVAARKIFGQHFREEPAKAILLGEKGRLARWRFFFTARNWFLRRRLARVISEQRASLVKELTTTQDALEWRGIFPDWSLDQEEQKRYREEAQNQATEIKKRIGLLGSAMELDRLPLERLLAMAFDLRDLQPDSQGVITYSPLANDASPAQEVKAIDGVLKEAYRAGQEFRYTSKSLERVRSSQEVFLRKSLRKTVSAITLFLSAIGINQAAGLAVIAADPSGLVVFLAGLLLSMGLVSKQTFTRMTEVAKGAVQVGAFVMEKTLRSFWKPAAVSLLGTMMVFGTSGKATTKPVVVAATVDSIASPAMFYHLRETKVTTNRYIVLDAGSSAVRTKEERARGASYPLSGAVATAFVSQLNRLAEQRGAGEQIGSVDVDIRLPRGTVDGFDDLHLNQWRQELSSLLLNSGLSSDFIQQLNLHFLPFNDTEVGRRLAQMATTHLVQVITDPAGVSYWGQFKEVSLTMLVAKLTELLKVEVEVVLSGDLAAAAVKAGARPESDGTVHLQRMPPIEMIQRGVKSESQIRSNA